MKNFVLYYISFIWMLLILVVGLTIGFCISNKYKKAEQATHILALILSLAIISFGIIFIFGYWPQ